MSPLGEDRRLLCPLPPRREQRPRPAASGVTDTASWVGALITLGLVALGLWYGTRTFRRESS